MNEDKIEQKRQSVMSVARSLFFQKGLIETEMKEVAEKAGISRSTLYRMFDSKDTLAFHIAEDCLLELFAFRSISSYGQDQTGFEILRLYTNDLMQTMFEKVQYLKYLSEFDHLFVSGYPDTQEARAYVVFNRNRQDRNLLLEILKKGLSDGSIRSDMDVNLLELCFGNAILGVAQRILTREKSYLEEYGYGREILFSSVELMLMAVDVNRYPHE